MALTYSVFSNETTTVNGVNSYMYRCWLGFQTLKLHHASWNLTETDTTDAGGEKSVSVLKPSPIQSLNSNSQCKYSDSKYLNRTFIRNDSECRTFALLNSVE